MISKNKIYNGLVESIGILGYGEVGRAIIKFYRNPRLHKCFDKQVRIKDFKKDDGLKGVDILNICIPWDNNFIKIVTKEIKEIKPKLTIIHSTIAPGTTKRIGDSTKVLVVHSPIRGIHPNLYSGIKTFVKYIGTDSKKAGELAKEHLESLGIKTKVFQPSITTEIGKLFSTSYYAVCVAWHGEMKEICDKTRVDFEKAVTDFNKTYNEGYKKLGKSNVVRPVLYPPKGGIGGHCLIGNAKILKEHFDSQAIELILKYKHKKKSK